MLRCDVNEVCVTEQGRLVGFVDVEQLTLASSRGEQTLAKAVDRTPGIIHWTR
jgi:hypothetical protein